MSTECRRQLLHDEVAVLEEEVFRLPYRAAHRAADRVGVGRDVHHHRHDALEFMEFPVVGEVILRR
jgi:hypothetical protein